MSTLILYSLFVSSKDGAKIEQEVLCRSVITNTFYVSTRVWFYENGHAKSLEYTAQEVVAEDKISSTKKSEYYKAIPTYLKVLATQ